MKRFRQAGIKLSKEAIRKYRMELRKDAKRVHNGSCYEPLRRVRNAGCPAEQLQTRIVLTLTTCAVTDRYVDPMLKCYCRYGPL